MRRGGKEPLRDVASEADSTWIWGNSRGGGGAPLRDRDGNSLTNLKLVLAGDVEPDHSPSKSPSKTDMYDYDNYVPRTSRRGEYDPYDDIKDRDSNLRRRGYDGRGSGGRRDDNDYDDYHNMPRRGGDARGRHERNHYGDSHYEDNYDRSRDRQPLRDRNSIPGLDSVGGSPYKNMPSSRITNVEDKEERRARYKKELTYQEELKRQIDEKKRKKDIEEHKEATLKQKELEEYLAVHYKGSVPSHVAKKVRAQKIKLQEQEYKLKLGEEEGASNERDDRDSRFGSPRRDGHSWPRRELGSPDRSRSVLDHEDDMPPRRGGRVPKGRPRFDDEPDGEEDLYGPPLAPRGGREGRKSLKWADDGDGDEEMGGRGGDRRATGMNRHHDSDFRISSPYDEPPAAPRGGKGSPSRGSGSQKWVPQAEYDELSALCDSLLKQQEDMQAELAKKGTAGRGGRTGQTARGVGGATTARARSQQQLHRERPKQTGPGTFGSGRPNSIQSTSRQGSNTAPTSARGVRSARERGGQVKPSAAPKVAFGRSIVDTKSKKDNDDVTIDARQRKLVKAGGAAMGRVMMKANERLAAHRESPSHAPMAPRHGRGGSDYGGSPTAGPQGFHKLAAQARSGPKVVTYEEDLGGSDRSRGRTSVELSGDSEYLRIGGEEVDLISGDQLDRLLVTARNARAAD